MTILPYQQTQRVRLRTTREDIGGARWAATAYGAVLDGVANVPSTITRRSDWSVVVATAPSPGFITPITDHRIILRRLWLGSSLGTRRGQPISRSVFARTAGRVPAASYPRALFHLDMNRRFVDWPRKLTASLPASTRVRDRRRRHRRRLDASRRPYPSAARHRRRHATATDTGRAAAGDTKRGSPMSSRSPKDNPLIKDNDFSPSPAGS